MRLSELFTKTKPRAPKDEIAVNAQLLIRAGFIHKEMAGVYDNLPLGLVVLNKIVAIIREEMNAIGSQEVALSSLQRREVWQATGRWDDKIVDNWFKTSLKSGTEIGLGPTHEEPLVELLKAHVASYRDLPQYIYQFQTKFRNELRAKSGILRGREFLMKDLYSFSRSESEHKQFYDSATTAYQKIFERVGLGKQTYLTFASGESFAKYSHEFQTVCAAGEDTIYIDRDRKLAVNKEVKTPAILKELGLIASRLEEKKAIEVGNIFSLGTRFSKPLGLKFTDAKGNEKPVIMGSYGIGPGRVMGAIVEVSHDSKGIIWPSSVAPAKLHLLSLGDETGVRQVANKLYEELNSRGIEVIYDDRAESAGVKLADADLMGIPQRVIVSTKTLAKDSVELKARNEDNTQLVKTNAFVKSIT